jgi:hypothetical protein
MNYCIYIILIIILIFILYSLFDLKSLYNNNIVSSNVEKFYQEAEINTDTMSSLLNKISRSLSNYNSDIPNSGVIGSQSRLLDDYDTEWGSKALNGKSCLDIKYYIDNYGSHPDKICNHEIGNRYNNENHYPKIETGLSKNSCARKCYEDPECISFMHSDSDCILSSTCNENTAISKSSGNDEYMLYVKDKNKIETNIADFQSDSPQIGHPLLHYDINLHKKCNSQKYSGDYMDVINNVRLTQILTGSSVSGSDIRNIDYNNLTKSQCANVCDNITDCTGFEFNYTGADNVGSCVLREKCNKYGCLEDDNGSSAHKETSVYTKKNNNYPRQPLCLTCNSMIIKHKIYENQFFKLYAGNNRYVYVHSQPKIQPDILDRVSDYTVSKGIVVKLYSTDDGSYEAKDLIETLEEKIYRTPVSTIINNGRTFKDVKSFEIIKLDRFGSVIKSYTSTDTSIESSTDIDVSADTSIESSTDIDGSA